jgi:hypothetical protein
MTAMAASGFKLKRFKFFSVPSYNAIKTYNRMAVKLHTF